MSRSTGAHATNSESLGWKYGTTFLTIAFNVCSSASISVRTSAGLAKY
jgi:hypothetical protein